MLREVSRLVDFHVHAVDGPVGRVHDILVDDDYWIVRGAVVELSAELGGARVLASPGVLRIPHWEEKLLPLKITSETAAGLPPAPEEESAPEPRPGLWRFSLPLWLSPDAPAEETDSMPPGEYAPGQDPSSVAAEPPPPAQGEGGSPAPGTAGLPQGIVCCRSAIGYLVRATNGVAGRFRDFLVSDVKWVVRYLLVDTGPWLFRRKVMVVPEQVERVNRAGGVIELRIRAEEVRQSQRYDRQTTVRPGALIEQQSPARSAGSRSPR